MPYTGSLSSIPKGWYLCDGSNDTPDLTGRFLEGVTSGVKEFKEPGLPNITGYMSWVDAGYIDYSNGALVGSLTDGGHFLEDLTLTRKNGSPDDIYFDASRSNSIYGSSDTVQPASYTVYYIMRVK